MSTREPYFEVKFPTQNITVIAKGINHQQAVEIISQSVVNYVRENVRLVEPEPEPVEVPEGVEATFE